MIINKDLFNSIETENEAYWLGFIIADGYVYKTNLLRIDIKDQYHLEKLSCLIYSDYKEKIKIRDLGYGDIYYFSCAIKKIVENLVKYGVVQNKSKITKLPIINDIFYRHFIRGLFDGDGCLTFSMDKNYRRYKFSIVGNYDLMIDVKKIIFNETEILLGEGKMKSIYNIYKKGNQQIMKLLEWLYKDSNIFLERKYEKYKDMLNYYNLKNK